MAEYIFKDWIRDKRKHRVFNAVRGGGLARHELLDLIKAACQQVKKNRGYGKVDRVYQQVSKSILMILNGWESIFDGVEGAFADPFRDPLRQRGLLSGLLMNEWEMLKDSSKRLRAEYIIDVITREGLFNNDDLLFLIWTASGELYQRTRYAKADRRYKQIAKRIQESMEPWQEIRTY